MTAHEQAAPTAPALLWCPRCQQETPQWRGLVSGKVSFVCRQCWAMSGERQEPRTLESDLREDR